MEDVPAHGRGVGTRWALRSLPVLTILWFYDSVLSVPPRSRLSLQMGYWICSSCFCQVPVSSYSSSPVRWNYQPFSTGTKFFVTASDAQRALSSAYTLYKLAEQPSSLLLLRERMCGYWALHREEKAYNSRESLRSLMQSYIPEHETY